MPSSNAQMSPLNLKPLRYSRNLSSNIPRDLKYSMSSWSNLMLSMKSMTCSRPANMA